MSTSRFTPGRLLLQKEKWLELAAEVYRLGGVVEKVALEAFEAGEVNMRSTHFMNFKAKDITFNNYKYSSWEALKNAKIPNYGSVKENLEDVEKEVNNLVALDMVDEVQEFDDEHVVSPIHWIKNVQPDGSTKVRLVHHDKNNVFYTKPKCPLPQLHQKIYAMSHLDKMNKQDAKKCFYQFGLSKASSKMLAFEFVGTDGKLRKFTWRVLPFGVSGATYVVQAINKVFADYYALKFRKFIIVYIDDFGYEPHENHFLEIASSLGFIFNPSKAESGSVIDLLGWTLNFNSKTATITSDKRQKIELAAAEILKNKKIRLDTLQSFIGRIGFAARVSKLGRLNSFYLDRSLAMEQSVSPLLDVTKWVDLTADMEKEVKYWRDIKEHQPVSFKAGSKTNLEKSVWTDSSTKKWAVKVDDQTWSGQFKSDQKDWPIILKEAEAVKKFIFSSKFSDKSVNIFVDNLPLVKSFNKKFSKNEKLHQLIKEMHLHAFSNNNFFELTWISTQNMKENGADDASRGKFYSDENSLSEAGVGKAKKLLNLEENDEFFDLFSSPADNVFDTNYFSQHNLEDDPQNMGEGAFELLERLEEENRKLHGLIWAFPPRHLALPFLEKIVGVGLEEEAKLYLLIEADLVVTCLEFIRPKFSCSILKFSKPRDRRLYRNRPALPRSILLIEKL